MFVVSLTTHSGLQDLIIELDGFGKKRMIFVKFSQFEVTAIRAMAYAQILIWRFRGHELLANFVVDLDDLCYSISRKCAVNSFKSKYCPIL